MNQKRKRLTKLKFALAVLLLPVSALGQGALAPGENHAGTIGVGEEDNWTLTADLGDTIVVSITEDIPNGQQDSAFRPRIRILDPDGTEVRDTFANVSISTSHVVAKPGTFTVIVSDSLNTNAAAYTLRVAQAPKSFIVPTGDEGGELTNGENHAGTIDVGDLDLWTVDAELGDTLLLSIAEEVPDGQPESAFRPRIRLFDPEGTEVRDTFANLSISTSHVVATPGTFTVLVSDSLFANTADYTLRLAHAPKTFIVPDGDEGGELTNGENHTGTMDVGDFDLWTVEAELGDTLLLSIAEEVPDGQPESAFRPRIRLFDPDGTEVRDTFANLSISTSHVVATPGTFTVLVSDSLFANTADYTLRLAHAPKAFIVPLGDEGGPMTNGENHTGTMDVGDFDLWTVEAELGDTLLLSIAEEVPDGQPESAFRPRIRLFDPDGTEVRDTFANVSISTSHVVANPGTFKVLVSDSLFANTAEYTLRLAHAPKTFITPDGDEGGIIINGANQSGSMEVGDFDMWSIEAELGDTINLSIAEEVPDGQPESAFRPRIRLFDPNGSEVRDTFGNIAIETSHVVATPGTFTVLVSDSLFANTADYTLRLAHATKPFIVPDGDEGDEMPNGETLNGTINVGDFDIWSFEAEFEDEISLTVTEVVPNGQPESAFRPRIRLFDPDGSEVRDTFGNLTAIAAHIAAKTGTYMVLISDSNFANAASYTLGLVKLPPDLIVPATQTINEEELFSAQISVTDPTGNNSPASFTLVSGPAGVSITPNGSNAATVSWTPDSMVGPSTQVIEVQFNMNIDGSVYSDTETFTINVLDTITGGPAPSKLVNISTRGFVGTGEGLMIAGFVIDGTEPMEVVVRGLGPTIGIRDGVNGVVPDPTISVFSLTQGATVVSNDDWEVGNDTAALQSSFDSVGAGEILNGKDAATAVTLDPGGYALFANDTANLEGIGLVEVFDKTSKLNPDADTKLANISTRAFVGSGDAVMIAGFSIEGGQPLKILVQGVGEGIAGEVTNPLADPSIIILDLSAGGTVAANNDWESDGQAAEIQAASVAFGSRALSPGSKDAAVIVVLEPNKLYGVLLSGADGGEGIAVVEVFDINSN